MKRKELPLSIQVENLVSANHTLQNYIKVLEEKIAKYENMLQQCPRFRAEQQLEEDDWDDLEEDDLEDDFDDFDDDDFEDEGFDFGDEETTIYEVKCVCGEIIDFDEDTLEQGSMICPNCGETLEFSLEDDEDEE